MEAKDLRLGNYVKVPREDQSPFRIDEFEFLDENDCKIAKKQFIGENEVHPLTWYLKDIEPIELSEEWLLKFGFNRQPWGLVKGGLIFKDHNHQCERLTLTVGNGFERHVWYIHELQNLFFALVGSELELKNK